MTYTDQTADRDTGQIILLNDNINYQFPIYNTKIMSDQQALQTHDDHVSFR